MAKEQRQVYFSGPVQGVGFRYMAVRTAGGYDVAGYVRNLEDGRVEVVAEGEEQDVAGFVAELVRRMGHCIRKQTQNVAPFTGQYHGFNVEY